MDLFRLHQRGFSGAVLAAFVGVWLLLAAEPCMAATAAHPDCPHCPQAMTQPACADAMAAECSLPDAVVAARADGDPAPVAVHTHAAPTFALAEPPPSLAHLQPEHTGPPCTVRYCRFRE